MKSQEPTRFHRNVFFFITEINDTPESYSERLELLVLEIISEVNRRTTTIY